ncbi:CAP domain-containing protein [Salinibius halmophilus]|uniref:CAP domain-containing protein n=1 Tax=Salinibius halmophilus TaxID=1853216 RepID=UPI000E6758E4|nr:CAP domain-containing protein [Salinibius halmophilus]
MQKICLPVLVVIALTGCTDAPGTAPSYDNIAANYCGYATPGYANDMLNAINNARASGASCGSMGYYPPTTPVAYNCQLTSAALTHTNDMVQYNFFSHTGSNGWLPAQRVADSGYSASFVAENLAAGPDNAYTAVNRWLASDGHCANLMSPNAREFGVAYSNGWINNMQHIWTTVFAAPR